MPYLFDHFASIISDSALEKIALKSKFIKRKTKSFSARSFVLSLLQSVSSGRTSFFHLSTYFNTIHEHSISRQAIHKKFNKQCLNFLEKTVDQLLKKGSNDSPLSAISDQFNRVLLEDCTVLKVHQDNHKIFPGNGNGCYQTAGAKIHHIIDWVRGETVHSSIHKARDADQSLGFNIVKYLRKNDLLIRDMGFFKLPLFQELTRIGVHWISRLPANIKATEEGSNRKLDEILKDKSKTHIEGVFHLGNKEKSPCRLIAKRLPSDIVSAHKRKRRSDAKRRGVTPNKESFIRDEWSIVCCNLQIDLPTDKIYQLYQIRWNIEIQFRGIKQALNIKKATNRKMNYYHLRAIFLTVIIYQILCYKWQSVISTQTKLNDFLRLSYEKLCQLLSKAILNLTSKTLYTPIEIDKRLFSQGKRSRPTSYSKTVAALS